MTEMVKTVLFVVAAAGALALAFAMGPSNEVLNVDELVGMRLNQFEVDVAKRLKIVKFDQETATTREFEVAENDGLWTIPSKQGYPADATRQMAEAATMLIDREVLRVATTTANEHEALGVIDPSASKLDSKAEGVGTRITLTDSNDSTLADMIIGKAVKDADGQYHIRNADQDVVYVVNLEPEKLSTKFEDWIEDDLLQLNSMDIRHVDIKDYSAELQPILTASGIQMQVQWDRRGEMSLRYDQGDSKWQAEKLQEFDVEKKELVDYELAEDEQINNETLQELRSGLDDLLLVDVERKPAGLSADLKAGSDFLKNQDAATSLIGRGFAPLSLTPGSPPEILSTEGELVCTLEDGVEYVLRFGNLQIDGEGGEAESETDPAAEGAEDSENDEGIHRYLFVMARFNDAMIEAPELEDLPELPPESEEASSEDNTTENAETEEPDAEEPETGDANAEEADTEETEGESASADGDAAEDPTEALKSEREAIEKANERKQNEYQEKIEAGKKRVAELNDRFGDWYYVISNDVYKKIHLSRDEVIETKEKEGETAEGTENAAGAIPGLPQLPLGNN